MPAWGAVFYSILRGTVVLFAGVAADRPGQTHVFGEAAGTVPAAWNNGIPCHLGDDAVPVRVSGHVLSYPPHIEVGGEHRPSPFVAGQQKWGLDSRDS